VLGVAVLASVFTAAGGYGSPQAFVSGLIPAVWVAVAVLAAGALVALALPSASQQRAAGRRSAGEAPRAPRGAAPVIEAA